MRAVIGLLYVVFPGELAGQGARLTRGSADSLITPLMATHHVPGAALAIVQGDSTLLAGYGFANRETKVRFDPRSTVFRLASTAKLFVATAVAGEVAAGTLDLDQDVNEIQHTLQVPGREGGPVTLRHLLTHTAGFDERAIGYAARSRASMVPLREYLADRLPHRGWPTGEVLGYSNHGFGLAALVMEDRTGVGFDRSVELGVFAPLEMTETFYLTGGNDHEIPSNGAIGYQCGESGCTRAATLYSNVYPAGLAYSTASDMAKFVAAQLGRGLSAEVRGLLQQRQFSHHPSVPGIGLGFFEQSWNGRRVLAHSGVVPGARSLLVIVPDIGAGFFLAANGGDLGFGNDVADRLLTSLLGSRRDLPPPPAPGPLDRFAGSYRMTRYSHKTIEKFPEMFSTGTRVVTSGDTLFLQVGGDYRPFFQVDSLLFRDAHGDRFAAFRQDASGGITHLFAPATVFGAELSAAFERVGWSEVPYFLNEYASWIMMIPLLAGLAWAVGALVAWLVRRLKRREVRGMLTPGRAALALLAFTIPLLFAVFGMAFVARSTRELSSGGEILFGLTIEDGLLLSLPFLVAAGSMVLVAGTVRAWRGRWFSLPGRVVLTLIAMGSILQVHFLVWWNYLPPRW